MNKYHVLFRACDKVESVHKVKRPFELSKLETIKISFYSMYQALQKYTYTFTVIGDDLSEELLTFFSHFDDVNVINETLGSAAKSLQKQIDLALALPDSDWVYMVEDDYLHVPYAFDHLDEFIENKNQYLKTTGKKKNYMNKIIGNLAEKPVIIHTPDYPDRYDPPWKRHSFIFLSKYCHWRQISNTTHTFMLEVSTLKRFEKEVKASAVGPSDSKLSEKVYGRLLFKKRALCLSPIKGVSTHMTEGVMTPLIDWETISQNNIEALTAKGLW